MNTTRVEDANWLRNNIFHTRRTANGKLFNLIIDSGSCENVVSQEMVDKLKLKTEKKPTTYKLAWFKKGNEVTVDKRCLVSFSIGKSYQDSIWCDVVPMDACPLSVGRPWQYDRKTFHDGYNSTYTFWKDGIKMILGPSKREYIPKPVKGEGNSFLTVAEFLKEFKDEDHICMLVVKELNAGSPIPSLLGPLMKEYVDVIPDVFQAGLPPMSLRNKAAYRMSPNEHKEMQKQVIE